MRPLRDPAGRHEHRSLERSTPAALSRIAAPGEPCYAGGDREVRIQSGIVRGTTFDERQPASSRCHHRELNLLGKELLLRRNRRRRDGEGRANLPRADLSRRAACQRDTTAAAMIMLTGGSRAPSRDAKRERRSRLLLAIGQGTGRSTLLAFLFLLGVTVRADSLGQLADDFWKWRAQYAPFSGDDVNRIERPGGMRDWSKAAIEMRHADLEEFKRRWRKIDMSNAPVAQQVDYRLIGSALSRVHWELEGNPPVAQPAHSTCRSCANV